MQGIMKINLIVAPVVNPPSKKEVQQLFMRTVVALAAKMEVMVQQEVQEVHQAVKQHLEVVAQAEMVVIVHLMLTDLLVWGRFPEAVDLAFAQIQELHGAQAMAMVVTEAIMEEVEQEARG